ncbi:hypothetical protein L6R29_04895 [Myxococcota bacterium]|nr:hypothetical protein [Myxococcota bacterium]
MEQQSAREVEVFVEHCGRSAPKKWWFVWSVCLGWVVWGVCLGWAWGKHVQEDDRYFLFLEGESAYLGEEGGERLRRLLSSRGFLLVAGIDAATIRLQIQSEGHLTFRWRKIQRVYQVPEHYRESGPRVRSVLLFAQAFLDSYRSVLPKAPSKRKVVQDVPIVPKARERTPPNGRGVVRFSKEPKGRRVAVIPRVIPTTKPAFRRSFPRVRGEVVGATTRPRLALATTRPMVRREPPMLRRPILPMLRPPKPMRRWMAEQVDVGGATLLRPWLEPQQGGALWWGSLEFGGMGVFGVFPAVGVGGSLVFSVGRGRWLGFVGGGVCGWLGLSEGMGLQIQPMVGVGVRLWEGPFSGELRLFTLMDVLRVAFRDRLLWRLRGGGGMGLRLDYAPSERWSVFVWLSGALYPSGFTFWRGDEALATAGYWQARVDIGFRFRLFGG